MKPQDFVLPNIGNKLAGTLQLYVPRPRQVQEILKPTTNVTWTSTAEKLPDGSYTSEWVEWCKTEMPQWLAKGGALFKVKPGAKILSMNTDKDAFKIAQYYGVQPPKNPMDWITWSRKFPWSQVAKDFDAIHHIPGSRMSNILMSSWDVESTAWFNNNFLDYVAQVNIDV